jgi:hypothetical protein
MNIISIKEYLKDLYTAMREDSLIGKEATEDIIMSYKLQGVLGGLNIKPTIRVVNGKFILIR